MRTLNFTKTRICCRCGHDWDLCVPVAVPVPDAICCSPGRPIRQTGTVRSEIACPRCRCVLLRSDDELRAAVEGELCRRAPAHAQRGTVLLDCR